MKVKDASSLVEVGCDLQQLLELVSMAQESDEIKNQINIQVKGKGDDPVILPTLKKCHKKIDLIDPDGDIFGPIHDEFNECIEYLDKNYSVKSRWLKLPESLREKDFEKISDNLDRILRTLLGYSENLTIMAINGNAQEKISKNVIKNMDKKTKDDYSEAIHALNFGLTTASYMMLCRVAEKLATSYYEKFMHAKFTGKRWNEMYFEIKKKHESTKTKRSVLALYDFLREKRNEALHPGKRFTGKDCQKILHYLEDFQTEISK